MSADQRSLPLFPLNTVLFPKAELPLHIFEERYRLMIRHCLEEADSRFGVVLIRSGSEVGEAAEPHDVGTVAHIIQVQELEDGRSLINIIGEQRFWITEITEQAPYMKGIVELLEDDAGDVTAIEIEKVREMTDKHIRLIMGLTGEWVRNVIIPKDPVDLSFYVPAELQTEAQEKQSLLEEMSTAKRLDRELLLLEAEAETLKEQVAAEWRRRIRGF